jgi:uncharacterized protein YfaP (DUF2135 family)
MFKNKMRKESEEGRVALLYLGFWGNKYQTCWLQDEMGEGEIMRMLLTFVFMEGTGEQESLTTGLRIAGHQ